MFQDGERSGGGWGERGIIQGKSLIEERLVFEEIQCTVILSIIFTVFVVIQVQLWALLACIVFLLMLVLDWLLYFLAFDWLRPAVLFFLNWTVCLFIRKALSETIQINP